MQDTPPRRGASIRSTLRPPEIPDLDDRYNALLAADARQAIRGSGRRNTMREVANAFRRGLSGWRALADVRAFDDARARLDAAGSDAVHRFDHWQPAIRDAKRYTMRHISDADRRDCSTLATVLGLSAERMAGLCVIGGLLDVPTVPLPTNSRLAGQLREVCLELRDRVRQIRRLCGTAKPSDRPVRTTWKALVDSLPNGNGGDGR